MAKKPCYFERITDRTFRATADTGGAWNTAEQHIAPALGLMAHAIEADHAARRGAALRIARISYDILGTLPIAEVAVDVSVVRPGRTIELVEARLSHAGLTAVVARAWLLDSYDTGAIAGSALSPIPPPDATEPWSPASVWPGGYIAGLDVRRTWSEPGRAVTWIRTPLPLIGGETVSATTHALSLLDTANGMAARADPADAAFPNVDLTVHLFDEPRGDWLGLDIRVSFGPSGLGLTHSVIHDLHGPIGTVSQSLTVRPRRPGGQ